MDNLLCSIRVYLIVIGLILNLIIISGPSGSGKTFLAKRICKEFNHINIINTDSYYRDNFMIKILSLYFKDIYDRIISIKRNELIDTLTSLLNNEELINSYYYNFKTRKSTKKTIIRKRNQYTNQIVILEGIFAHRLIKNFKNNIFMKILCIEDKSLCLKRRIERDLVERGRKRKEVEERFQRSWEIFHNHSSNFKRNNEIIYLDNKDKEQYRNIINRIESLNLKTKKNMD